MNAPVGLEKCWSFINCNLQPAGQAKHAIGSLRRPAIAISRQSGCGAHIVAEQLARYLQSRAPAEKPPWTVFDRNLVETVLADHHLPGHLARFMPEDRVSAIDDAMRQIFGQYPPAEALVGQTSETILRLAELGNVILLGRGANILTAAMPHVVHVRIVAPLAKRIANMEEFEHLSHKAAAERIHQEDQGRQRYVRRHFNRDIDDPLLYHLVINTGLVSLEDTAKLIGDFVLERAPAAVSA